MGTERAGFTNVHSTPNVLGPDAAINHTVHYDRFRAIDQEIADIERQSPFYGILRGIDDIDAATAAIEELRTHEKDFKRLIDGILEAPPGVPIEELRALRAETIMEFLRRNRDIPLVDRGAVHRVGYTAEQLAQLFTILKDAKQYDAMLEFYEKEGKENSLFLQAPTVIEGYAKALVKKAERLQSKYQTGDTTVRDEIERLQAESRTLIEHLIRDDDEAVNGDAFVIRAKITLADADRYPVRSERRKDLQSQALRELEEGFEHGCEFYPAIYLAYNTIIQGAQQNNWDMVEEGIRLSEIANVAAKKAGGRHAVSPWVYATMLAAGALQGKIKSDIIELLHHVKPEDQKRGNEHINQLRKVGEALQAMDINQHTPEQVHVYNIRDAITRSIRLFENVHNGHEGASRGNGKPLRAEDGVDPAIQEKTKALFSRSFAFYETTSATYGTMPFGGESHDHLINRWDFSQARRILKHLEVHEEDSIFRVNRKLDKLLRAAFQTEALEKAGKDAHIEQFDQHNHSIAKMTQAGKGVDTRTSPIIDLAIGKGDCREHAIIKQLLFDVWRTDRINSHLRLARKSLKEKNHADYQAHLNAAKELVGFQMLILNTEVHAPAEIDSFNNPHLDADGKLVANKDGSVKAVESHSWNAIVQLGHDGVNELPRGRAPRNRLIQNFYAADSFYHNRYPFGGDTKIGDTKWPSGIDPSSIKVRNGKLGIEFGEIEVSNNKKISIWIQFPDWAGDRSKLQPANGDDLGYLPQYYGLTVDPNGPDIITLLDRNSPEYKRIQTTLETIAEKFGDDKTNPV